MIGSESVAYSHSWGYVDAAHALRNGNAIAFHDRQKRCSDPCAYIDDDMRIDDEGAGEGVVNHRMAGEG